MSISKSSYLPGLNTLRFLAAFLVILSHAQQSIYKLNIVTATLPIFDRGREGVEFFFVLSGFLITFLLAKEINKTGTISIKDFYLRRVFRIWPLYFIIVLVGLVLLGFLYPILYHKPYFEFPIWKWVLLYICFLPNLATILYPMGLLHPLWSIGVEEQFYLFWAPLVKLFRNKMLFAIILFVTISSIWQILLQQEIIKPNANWYGFFTFQKFYAMSIGSFFGYVLFNWKEKFQQSFFCNKIFQTILIFITIAHLFTTVPYSYLFFYRFFLSIVFGLIIINTVCANTTIFKLEKKPFVYLGTISYGLYMYHMTIDYLLRTVFSKIIIPINIYLQAILYHALLLGLTIILASLSFKYVESYFLKLKHKYDT
jgi:peptidoglycan/LPS O-acetylase OafA/YrhL